MTSYTETLIKAAAKRRSEMALETAKQRRRVAMGYVAGAEMRPNGSYSIHTPKGYVPYDTPTLKRLVLERMEMRAKAGLSRSCPINGRHQLQIRGKDLRRLKKAIPGLKQEGRCLVIA